MIIFAKALKAIGIDVIDCSSGGMVGQSLANVNRAYGFQVGFAKRIKKEVGIATQAVGLITQASQAEQIIAEDQADLVAIGRAALKNPNWPLQAQAELGQYDKEQPYAHWPLHGWWLASHHKTLVKLDEQVVTA
jgi:2,4-dienoyl-CoA reductase-like NADH-dependent reductase (Old Yellow Enzyme family)